MSIIKALIAAIKTDIDDTKIEIKMLKIEFLNKQQAGEKEKENLRKQMQHMEEETKKVIYSPYMDKHIVK